MSLINPTEVTTLLSDAILAEQYGVRTFSQLTNRVDAFSATRYLIPDFVPSDGIGLFVGDSGLGKSPLLYQAAVCVAAGVPFLERPVQQGRVLFMDAENGQVEVRKIIDAHCGFLNVDFGDSLRFWNFNDTPNGDYASVIKATRPDWVIIDPLKAMYPGIETDNTKALAALKNLRELRRDVGCAVTGVHHIRKPSEGQFLDLETGSLREWLLQARGPRELITGTDVRFGIDYSSSGGENVLVLRGFERVIGETPAIRVARMMDEDANPIGYQLCQGFELLNPEHRAVLDALPESFRFKDAQHNLNKASEATQAMLKNFIRAGVVRHEGKGKPYVKILRAETARPSACPLQMAA